MSGILKKIIDHKLIEIERDKIDRSVNSLEEDIDLFDIRPFENSLKCSEDDEFPHIIAEIKKASPSKGLLSQNFSPSEIAKNYDTAGATCISVLTESEFFKGSLKDLLAVKKNCSVPILRKDFIVDPYQIVQSRAFGADCVLLIVAAIPKNLLFELEEQALSLGMNVLVETHNEEELEIALMCKTNLIGINNRNLGTFKVDINTSVRLCKEVPKSKLVISESGISSLSDLNFLMSKGIFCFLIGESLMKNENPGLALKSLLSKRCNSN
uniref:Indole-3-glycerol phosphate synthase n=1 Tax=uncultured beta proteobacterium HF0130_04F21 TaxID=710819 RepID=E0XSU1_9PROT|nr:indole-3-glycerol phosphate synthase [uncultured beta proteobacterium HF0130_04F21]